MSFVPSRGRRFSLTLVGNAASLEESEVAVKAHRAVFKILLVDSHAKPREMRAGVFRQRHIDVDSAGSFGEARVFWTSGSYRLILLSPRETPQESIDFFQMVKRKNPSQRIAFLVGSPEYVSFAIPEGMVAA